MSALPWLRPARVASAVSPRSPPAKSCLRCTRGVAYVEFLIAFPPLFMAFLGTWQLSRLWGAKLIVDHAAVAGARAAAVVIPQPDTSGTVTNTLTDASTAAIQSAVNVALAPAYLRGWITGDFSLSFPSALGSPSASNMTQFVPEGNPGPPSGVPSMVNTQVQVNFVCTLPIVSFLVCGQTGLVTITGAATFPYQGAYYDYQPVDSNAQNDQ